MEPSLFMALVFGASIAAGTLGALLGIGGGMILVPFLTLYLHVNIHLAIGASLVSIIATSSGSAAAYLRDRLTNVRVGMFLELGTVTGAIAGAVLAGIANPAFLNLLFGAILMFSAYMMIANRRTEHLVTESSPLAVKLGLPGSYHDPLKHEDVTYGVAGVLPGLGVMVLAGGLSALLGIGSGVFKVLAMDLSMRLPMKVSTTTSNFMIGVTGAASAGIYFFRGDINPYLAAPVAAGVVLGSMVGTRILMRIQSRRLRELFVVVLVVFAVQMAWKGVTVLWGALHA